MEDREAQTLLSDRRSLPSETEWVEFKKNNAEELGEYISALSNAACLHNKPYGFIVFESMCELFHRANSCYSFTRYCKINF